VKIKVKRHRVWAPGEKVYAVLFWITGSNCIAFAVASTATAFDGNLFARLFFGLFSSANAFLWIYARSTIREIRKDFYGV
jgi:hypothetical protein